MEGVSLAIVLAACAVAVVFDVRERRIPNALTGGAAAALLAAGAVRDRERLVAGALAAAFLGLPALLRPEGMGLGDAKLAGVLGLGLGPLVAVALLAALAAGTAYGAAFAVARGVGAARVATVPFAPFLALGALVALVWASRGPP
jgi:leader peptidase (prepilin peptidase)/N-methyltransferase